MSNHGSAGLTVETRSGKGKDKVVTVLHLAPCHEDVLEEWRYT
jgi:hypothetical protein